MRGEVATARAESDALHARAVAMVRAFEQSGAMPEPFDALAVDLARFQARRVPGYRRLCATRGVDLTAMTRAGQAPAVPADAFKLARVFAFDESEAAALFRTSGTTIGARGAHPMRHTRSYDAAALAFGRAMLAPDMPRGAPVLVLGPSSEEVPDSSLAHMCTLFARAIGGVTSGDAPFAFVRGGAIDVVALRTRVRSLSAPALVLATSFALVHLLDAVGPEGKGALRLPAGSRVMQTGGFKGRSREVSADQLRRDVARLFALEPRFVVGEYGMTELSSQFWEATVLDPAARHGVYVEPPWARVVPVDPVSLEPVADGDVGIARIEDLANVDSAFAVQTHDRARRVRGGFELLGRAVGAPPRGCSIALDEMLSSSAPDGP
jgi:hypothetical protein